ncbi:hypothetical protein SAMN05216371_1516 [Streptomyces sp. TLI_053]|uniref:hypothetical protein n=1 Tax=Streptomyces sp. TLI_053 TaxID=1855352 RepID=UPI00087CB3CD|nr:hypothetical protein [Streptomyces sp. TLI_053]SDT19772.1 hypothetical protein SAMN05216371_1516 [Streptomyces sp. TLI_053]
MTARLAPSMSAALALTASAVLLPALAVLGELRPTWVALGAYAALCAAVGGRSRPSAAPLIGPAAWLFHNGFVEHRHGALDLSAPAAEAAHVLLLTAAALVAALLAAPRAPRPGGRYDLAA